jgi:hypothetical protein
MTLTAALLIAAAVQAPRIEAPPSDPVTYEVRSPILKWNQGAKDNAELQSLRFSLVVDGNAAIDLAGVLCGPPTGQTPPTLYSCEVPIPDLPLGSHSLAVIVWIPAPALAQPLAPRIVR